MQDKLNESTDDRDVIVITADKLEPEVEAFMHRLLQRLSFRQAREDVIAVESKHG